MEALQDEVVFFFFSIKHLIALYYTLRHTTDKPRGAEAHVG